jgi:hypothetical protein
MSAADYKDINADRGPVLIGSVWPVAGIAVLAVAGRMLSRRLKRQPLKADDYSIVFGLLLGIACCICSTICVMFGIGKHIEKTELPNVKFWKTLFAYNQIYVMTGPVNKIAALLMYKRIFDTPFFRLVVFWMIILNIAWWLGMSISGIFTCIPVQAYWITDIPGKKCFGLLEYDIGYAVVNIGLDFFILMLPIHQVWRLQLTKMQKGAITLIFLLGAFACVTALIRLLVSVLHLNDRDFTWVYLDALIWTAVEPLVAVICVCLPTMRPVFHYLLPKRLTLSSYSRKEQGPYGSIREPRSSRKTTVTDELRTVDLFATQNDDTGSQSGLNKSVTDAYYEDDNGSTNKRVLPGENVIEVRHSIEMADFYLEQKSENL